jgi:uncharacterized protein (UPF0303 family)
MTQASLTIEQPPDFEHFSYEDAWAVGSALVARAQAEKLPVTISIWFGQQRIFHAALPGTSADNDAWVEKKARVVNRFRRSSLEVYEHYVRGNPHFFEAFGLSRSEYAPGEGAVPIWVRGSLIGVLAISGLETGGDHDLAVTGLRRAASPSE